MVPELPKDFKELFRLLNENGVEYLLIGGYAVLVHGVVRNTVDIDIAVSDDIENARKLVNCLTEFGFGGAELGTDLFSSPNSLVRIGVEPVKVEILNYLNGVEFSKAFRDRDTFRSEDLVINVINREDLIANKKAFGRLQDLADIERLEELQ